MASSPDQPVSALRTAAYTGARPDVVSLIADYPVRALDIGCSTGEVGRALKALGIATVWGIDLDPQSIKEATKKIDRAILGDAYDCVLGLDQSQERFDLVLCADVLEHLKNPEEVLKVIRRLVISEGQVILSLPDVRFWTTFYHLGMRGRFPRNDRGVHDRTHLSWFTLRDMETLVEESGFRIEKRLTHYRISDLPGSRLNRFAHFVLPLRPFLAYQRLFRLRPV